MAKEYGIRWTEWNRQDRLVTKERFFATEEAREQFINRLEERDNFNSLTEWSERETK